MRFGFVGLGFATEWLHLPAVGSLPGARSVGGFDLAPERQEAWARLHAGPVYGSVEELLDRGRPDVVIIATPPDSHAELCLTALEAGAHVICEKPFVSSLEEADRVLQVARKRDRWVAVNQEFRYMPIFAAVPRLLHRADVGQAVFIQCTQLMDLAPWEEKVAWRAAMPDRSLYEGGVHLVDLMHMISRRMPRTVAAMTSSGLVPGRRADAIHLVTLDYGGGLLGQITIDRLCKSGTRYVDLRVDCERASIRSSYGGRAFVRLGLKRGERGGVRVDFGLEGLAWVERGLDRQVVARNARRSTQKATAALYASTVEAFRRDVEPPTGASVARETLRVIEAAYRSARTEAMVALGP